MEEEGIVIETQGSIAKVQIEPMKDCEGCRLCSLGTNGTKVAEAENLIGAEKGERVVLELPSADLLKGASIVYLLPVVLFISGLIIGDRISPLIGFEEIKEGVSIITGLLSLLLAIFLICCYNKWIKKGNRFRPKIVKIILPPKPA